MLNGPGHSDTHHRVTVTVLLCVNSFFAVVGLGGCFCSLTYNFNIMKKFLSTVESFKTLFYWHFYPKRLTIKKNRASQYVSCIKYAELLQEFCSAVKLFQPVFMLNQLVKANKRLYLNTRKNELGWDTQIMEVYFRKNNLIFNLIKLICINFNRLKHYNTGSFFYSLFFDK